MDNLITSDCDLVIILSAPAIVHPNYNYYSYDQGRVFVVTVRPRQSGLLLKSYLHQVGTLGTGQRFTSKKRTVLVICFESEIDRLVYQLYGLTEEEIKIVEQS